MIFIRPINDPKAPGWRLRLERADGEMAKLAEERTLLEKVNDPEANLVEPADCFWLTREDAVWLRDGLSSLLASWPEPSHQVKPCAYCQQQPVLGHTTEDGMRPTSWSLMCECGRGSVSTESYDAAVARWNALADDRALAADSAHWKAKHGGGGK